MRNENDVEMGKAMQMAVTKAKKVDEAKSQCSSFV